MAGLCWDGCALEREHIQKRQPARVEFDVGEQGLDCNLSQSNRWKNFVETGGHSSN